VQLTQPPPSAAGDAAGSGPGFKSPAAAKRRRERLGFLARLSPLLVFIVLFLLTPIAILFAYSLGYSATRPRSASRSGSTCPTTQQRSARRSTGQL
jgi:hypothetical protein